MRFYIALFFCFVFYLSSCNDLEKVPADIMPLHEMAELLTDIHIIDGSLTNVPQQPDSLTKHGLGLYLAVLKLHHTDTVQFKKSMKFYALRPDLLTIIYTGVTKRLTIKTDSIRKADSIATVKALKANAKKLKAPINKTDTLPKPKQVFKLNNPNALPPK